MYFSRFPSLSLSPRIAQEPWGLPQRSRKTNQAQPIALSLAHDNPTEDWFLKVPKSRLELCPHLRAAFIIPCFWTPKVYAFQFLIRSCTLAAHRYIQLSDTWFGLKCIDILFEIVDKIGNIRQKSLFLASIEKVEDLTTQGLFPHRNNCLMLKRGSSRWNMPFQLCPSPPLTPLLLKQPD